MYIPLDYYRILGLPIQATAEQLRQAHRDRTLQLPRREYSDAATASRKSILDHAYAALSDPEQRKAYDASFLAKTYELGAAAEAGTNGDRPIPDSGEAHTPGIEVPDEQLVGALLLLQELGEYELVLRLGRPFLTGGSASLRGGRYGDPSIVYADMVLTVALACLELGREQWQQGQYENAAEALDTGQKLLLREGLFISVRGEIQFDLYRLRPYQVLELLALPEAQVPKRHKGLQILQEMLNERGGIDGTGDDQSGLSVDDFLRFIQQLRGYMTAAEQQALFEAEARRPSPVATYLAVYALIARGFADHQPGLIRRANELLTQLGGRQDVHLEQAVCALLLGQPEDASRSLELSQEYEPIAFIREHSQGAPDLLPGLCLYAERWLQSEVFTHFRDLSQQSVSLKDYFADHQVQAYLEALPEAPASAEARLEPPVVEPPVSAPRQEEPLRNAREMPSRTADPAPDVAIASSRTRGLRETRQESEESLIEAARARLAAGAAVGGAVRSGGVATMPPAAERVPPAEAVPEAARSTRSFPRSPDGGRPGEGGRSDGIGSSRVSMADDRIRRANRAGKRGISRLMLPLAVVTGVVALAFLLSGLLKAWQMSNRPATRSTAASVEASPTSPGKEPAQKTAPGAIAAPKAAVGQAVQQSTLDKPLSQQVIESWLSAKTAAMGSKHDVAALEEVLLDPALADWKKNAEADKREGWHREYKHQVTIVEVNQDKQKPEQATVVADVSETTESYRNGELNKSTSDDLRVEYSLLRQDGKWRIQTWKVVR